MGQTNEKLNIFNFHHVRNVIFSPQTWQQRSTDYGLALHKYNGKNWAYHLHTRLDFVVRVVVLLVVLPILMRPGCFITIMRFFDKTTYEPMHFLLRNIG